MAAASGLTFDTASLARFSETCKTLGEKTAKKAGRKAASKGATVLGKAVRKGIPKGKTGMLRKGIKRRQEKTWGKGKYVYDFMFNREMNDIFQKEIKNPGKYGGKNSKAYYPASMEYGFLTRKKGGGLQYEQGHTKGYNGRNADSRSKETQHYENRKVDGYHFMRNAVEQNTEKVRKTMEDTLMTELEKEWQKQ